MMLFFVMPNFSNIDVLLSRPDLLITYALLYVGWIPIAAVLVWGLLEVWLFHRREHYRHNQKYVFLAVDVPKLTEESPKALEHLFSVVSATWGGPNFREKWIDGEVSPVFSFEIVSLGGYIQYFIRTPARFRDMVEAALYAAYPDVEIAEAEDYTKNAPEKFPSEEWRAWGCEQKLKNSNYLPIRTYDFFEHKLSQELKDPLGVMLEQYSRLRPGEQLWTQILLQCDPGQAWMKEGVEYINKTVGKEEKKVQKIGLVSGLAAGLKWLPEELANQTIGMTFGEAEGEKKEDPWKFLRMTPHDKARLEVVSDKISKPGCLVKIRHIYLAKPDSWLKSSRDKMLKGVYNQYTNLDSNSFGRVKRVAPKDDYFWQRWFKEIRATNLVRAYRRRDGVKGGEPFILNSEELATLWHFPTILQKAPFISKTLAKRAEPPVQLEFAQEGETEFKTAVERRRLEPLPVETVRPRIPEQQKRLKPKEKILIKIATPKATPKLPRIPASPPEADKKNIPDALRVLLEPGVELEDVGLASPPEETKISL